VVPHDLDCLLGEIASVQLQFRIFVLGEHGERRVSSAGSNLKDGDGSGILLSYLFKYRELLLKPFAVLEEIGRIVLVEPVPPSCRIRVESNC
jgi:hypothetical protein